MSDDRKIPRFQDATVTGTAEVTLPAQRDAERGERARFALVIYSGDSTEVVRLTDGRAVVIGRDFPSHVQIDDSRVSRQHVRFVLNDGAVRVEDLGSRNGTRLNGERITTTTLGVGDELLLGSIRVLLAVGRPESASVPASSPEPVILRNRRVVELYEVAKRAARTNVPVLVLGETGTGKEHLARSIHTASPRAAGPWRALNCSAIPSQLVESTLFGHERGAFTGADKRTKGLFEEAAGGSVFLDEIAELALPAQAVLLRVLETKTIQRVGSTHELPIDVRVVAATHCDLEAAVGEGTFRRDLLHRIDTVTIELPPLRDRMDELEPLVARFLDECRRQWGVAAEGVEPEALERLRSYAWPGNIRQLRNAIERAALVTAVRHLRVEDLPPYLREPSAPMSNASPPSAPPADGTFAIERGLKPALREYESRVIEEALVRTGGNRLAAAKLLRVPRRTLYRRMQTLGFAAATDAGSSYPDEPD